MRKEDFGAVVAYPPEVLDALMKDFIETTHFAGTVQPWRSTPETYDDPDDGVVIKFDPSQPRDEDGKWSRYAAGQRRPGEEAEDIIEGGGGPERKKWYELQGKLLDATDAFIAAKEVYRAGGHADRALQAMKDLMESRRGGREVTLNELNAAARAADPEWEPAKKKLQAVQQLMQNTEAALKGQFQRMKIEVVTNIATEEAKRWGVHPSVIHVVDKEPPEFTVGDVKFREGGHFDPSDRHIEINAHNIDYGNAAGIRGIADHELSHFVYHELKRVADEEHDAYTDKAVDHTVEWGMTPWFHERFDQPYMYGPTTLKPEWREQVEKEFPASAVMAKLHGGQMFSGISEEMIKENGHSRYAKSYWQPEAIRARGTYESAINETMAEVTRYLGAPASWNEEHTPDMNSPWVKLTQGMHEWYRQQQKNKS